MASVPWDLQDSVGSKPNAVVCFDLSMALRRFVGIAVGFAVLALSALAAGVVIVYMTEYGQRRFAVAAVIAAIGAGVGILAYTLVTRACKSKKCSFAILMLLVVLLMVPILSMFYPGKITHSRFGLTVYGAIPVPSLDITVGADGILWFRDKSHYVSLEEVAAHLSSDAEVVVIGTGWHGAVQVDPAVQEIEGVEVHILRTPEAFALFNEYVSQGRKVILIAHSTC
jgi:hypothetical protein